MRITTLAMTVPWAETIGRWHYEEPYTFYDWRSDPDDLRAFLDRRNWPGRYYAAIDGRGSPIGFFQFDQEDGAVRIGLGLRPDLTGRGLGGAFLAAGLAFARERYDPQRFTLSVATFNRRDPAPGFAEGESSRSRRTVTLMNLWRCLARREPTRHRCAWLILVTTNGNRSLVNGGPDPKRYRRTR